MKTKLAATGRQRSELERQIGEIGKDQQRIRENMTRLDRNSQLYGRYVKKLYDQETQIEKLGAKVLELKRAEADQRAQLESYLLSLRVE